MTDDALQHLHLQHLQKAALMSDYWDLQTCPDCHATLASDGMHWATGERECKPESGTTRRVLKVEDD